MNNSLSASGMQVSGCFIRGNVGAVSKAGELDEYYDYWVLSVGGIVGYVRNGEITKSMFSGNVSGLSAVVGIAGEVFQVSVSDCIVRGQIQLTSTAMQVEIAGAGGIIGVSYGGSLTMNCYYEGILKDPRVAAIIGFRKEIGLFGTIYLELDARWDYVELPIISCCYYNGSVFTGKLTHIEEILKFMDVTYMPNEDYDENDPASEEEIRIETIIPVPYQSVSSRALSTSEITNKANFKDWDFVSVWGYDKDGNLILIHFGKAYESPAPKSLSWLWITLGCALFSASALTGGMFLYCRKKTELVTVTNTLTEKIYIDVKKSNHFPDTFSAREREIGELLLTGMQRKEIADKLFLSENTIKKYLTAIYEKTGCATKQEFYKKYYQDKE